MKVLIILSCIIVISGLPACVSKSKSTSYLTGGNIKYWDTNLGHSWRFSLADSSHVEYSYKNMYRVFTDYGDVVVENVKWDLYKGYLYFGPNGKWDVKYKIVHLSKDKLIVIDPKKIWGKDTLTFTPSPDQHTIPAGN